MNLPAKRTDLAYLAGMLDGEGTVGFKTDKTGRIYGYTWIYSTDIKFINWISQFGGAVSVKLASSNKLQKKPCFCWGIQNNPDVLEFLSAVKPYMRIKRNKARQVIRLMQAWKVQFDERQQLLNELYDSIILQHGLGENPYRISLLLGCSRSTVIRTLERNGLRNAS